MGWAGHHRDVAQEDRKRSELTPPGYTFQHQHVAHASGHGARVAIVHCKIFKTTIILPKLPFTTIELLRLQFINPHLLTYNVWVAYHRPSSS